MSDFRRRGFIRAGLGILKAARVWHSKEFSAADRKLWDSITGHGPLPRLDAADLAGYRILIGHTAKRLLVCLQNTELRAFQFDADGVLQPIPARDWSEPECVGVLEQQHAEALEYQSSRSQPAPRGLIYFSGHDLQEILQSSLDRNPHAGSFRQVSAGGFEKRDHDKQQRSRETGALMVGVSGSEQSTKKLLDEDGKRKVADLLQMLSQQQPRLSRPQQFEIVRELPEFRRYRIRDRDLRTAAKQAPLSPGRPRKR